MIFDSIDLNNDDWYVPYCLQQCRGLQSFRVTKLTSVCNISQSLDNIALEDACDVLEEERSELNLSLRGFDFGSTFQTAVEVLVANTEEIEEEEDKILRQIATETRRLEELELEVAAFSATWFLLLMFELKIQTAKSHIEWRKGVDGRDNPTQ